MGFLDERQTAVNGKPFSHERATAEQCNSERSTAVSHVVHERSTAEYHLAHERSAAETMTHMSGQPLKHHVMHERPAAE